MVDDSPLLAALTFEEGCKLRVYDDATGMALVPGMRIMGHPTIGIGIALDTGGISRPEAEYLLGNRVAAGRLAFEPLPWFARLDAPRQRAVLAMVFQLGAAGVLRFASMIEHLGRGEYQAAADAAYASAWARQTPARAKRVTAQLASGVDWKA